MKTAPKQEVDIEKVAIAVGTQLAKGVVRVAFIGYFANKTRAALKKDKIGFRDAYVISALVSGLAIGAYEAVAGAQENRAQYRDQMKEAGMPLAPKLGNL